jgi:hypothetical protein
MTVKVARRRGYTVAEIAIMAAIALVLLLIVAGLVRAVRVQDGWTASRLEGTSGGLQAVDSIRHDVLQAHAGPAAGGVRLPSGAVEAEAGQILITVCGDRPSSPPGRIRYFVDNRSRALRRNDRIVSGSRFRKFSGRSETAAANGSGGAPAGHAGDALVYLALDVGPEEDGSRGGGTTSGIRSRSTTVSVALLVRDQALRARYDAWVE